MSEWIKFNLGELITIKHGYAFSGKYITSVKNNNILVTPGNFKIGGGFKADKFKYFSSDDYPKEYLFDGGELIVTMTDLSKETDTLGFVALVPKDTNKYLHNQRVGLINILDESVVDKLYLYWKLRTNEYQSFIANSASGTSVMHTSPKKIYEYSFLLPSLIEQKAIASVLSSLDDKIDLLHRQNKTLESMAETLFRQWFVEEVDDSWILSSIGEVFDIKGGATPSTKESLFWNGNINWTSPRDLSGAKSIYLLSTERKITELGLSKISSGLLPNNTLLMSSRAPVGYLAITDIELAINQGYIAILEHEIFGCEYMYLWCKVNMDIIKNSANGSVFQEISKASFKKIPFLIPDDERVKSFNKQGKILFKKIKSNTKNIQTLEKLRDTLLPKLMSGEVRVNYTPEEIKQ
ncbi:MAG: restriction endonuclease subunit S [Proteus hauseri]|nr:restriction endonuclease subunit S [Proteus hauseri]